MKAAIVTAAGQAPVYGTFPEPVAGPGECVVAVAASALSHLARGRAEGTHYSAAGAFPFVPGVDGVGRLAEGRRVAFLLPRAPHGGMAERTLVPASRCVPVPDALDDVAAAALINAGMSSFAAFTERARLMPGETVLVNGATGAAGRLAVAVARHLGAGRVVAAGRDPAKLAGLGADATVALGADGPTLDARLGAIFAAGVDVVIDYLWGTSAERLLAAAVRSQPEVRPLRFVQVGNMTGREVAVPAAALRAKAIALMGSGLGSVPLDRLTACAAAALQAAAAGGFAVEATRAVPLEKVEGVWSEPDGGRRVVFVVGAAGG